MCFLPYGRWLYCIASSICKELQNVNYISYYWIIIDQILKGEDIVKHVKLMMSIWLGHVKGMKKIRMP